uniref:Uncharacterized protein n=1 Tax=Alexandrium andersonii TaxID=327968 RepID=A0A7S2JCJ0_9DINO
MSSPLRAALLAIALAAVPAVAIRAGQSGPFTYNDPCPFGYGTNCGGGGEIDSATKAKVANILEGILKGLTSHKALVQGSDRVAKVLAPKAAADAGPSPESAKVKGALQILLVTLQKRGQESVAKALGGMLTSEDPHFGCESFGACGAGSDHPIDSETKEKVAAILEGIIRNLSSHK